MEEIMQFVRDRLDEDEREAKSVLWEGSGNSMDWELTASATVFTGEDEFYAVDRNVARHIVRHDPARVLADVEAKRRIVDLMASMLDAAEGDSEVDHYGGLSAAEDTLKLLAFSYAEHSDYREEWRP